MPSSLIEPLWVEFAALLPALLAPTLAQLGAQVQPLPATVTAHLDRGYDSHVTRALLAALGFTGEIARKGVPAPVQAGNCFVSASMYGFW